MTVSKDVRTWPLLAESAATSALPLLAVACIRVVVLVKDCGFNSVALSARVQSVLDQVLRN